MEIQAAETALRNAAAKPGNRRSSRRTRERSPQLTYEKLSEKDLEEAIALANSVFPSDRDAETSPEFDYRAGLDPERYREDLERIGIGSLQHWTVKDQEKILGLTGLYRVTSDPADVVWLDWFCTAPEARGKGIGRAMLEWTVAEAERQGFRKICLWTTDDPNEAAAQRLYESMGFKIVSEEVSPDGTRRTFRREKALSDRKLAPVS